MARRVAREEYEHLCWMIKKWNRDRLELFEITMPNEVNYVARQAEVRSRENIDRGVCIASDRLSSATFYLPAFSASFWFAPR